MFVWKPIEFWEMEDVFILTGIGILIAAILLGLLIAWLQARSEGKDRDDE